MKERPRESVFVVEVKSVLANRVVNTPTQTQCYYTNKYVDICQYAAPRNNSPFFATAAFDVQDIDEAIDLAIAELQIIKQERLKAKEPQ